LIIVYEIPSPGNNVASYLHHVSHISFVAVKYEPFRKRHPYFSDIAQISFR
jgi:hypothetical protein